MSIDKPTTLDEKVRSALLCGQAHYRELTQMGAQDMPRKRAVLQNDMMQLVLGQPVSDQALLMSKINQDLNLRRRFIKLLESFQFDESAAQAAASSEQGMQTRSTEKFSLSFEIDEIETSQVYVILRIFHPSQQHFKDAVTLHVIDQESRVSRVSFPAISSGQTQLLFDINDDEFLQLSNPNARIVLL